MDQRLKEQHAEYKAHNVVVVVVDDDDDDDDDVDVDHDDHDHDDDDDESWSWSWWWWWSWWSWSWWWWWIIFTINIPMILIHAIIDMIPIIMLMIILRILIVIMMTVCSVWWLSSFCWLLSLWLGVAVVAAAWQVDTQVSGKSPYSTGFTSPRYLLPTGHLVVSAKHLETCFYWRKCWNRFRAVYDIQSFCDNEESRWTSWTNLQLQYLIVPSFRFENLSLGQPHPVFSSAHQHHFEPFSKVPTQSSTNFTWQLPHHHVET